VDLDKIAFVRRRTGRVALVILGALGGLLLARGMLLVGYEPVRSDRYLWGAFHVHSTMSDGLLPLEGIAREAKSARVSFVLLSDHGAPHPEASLVHESLDGVRFIGGSEVGLPDGHLIVSGVSRIPSYALPPFPPDAIAEAAEWGGVAVVTYPEDPVQQWRYWESDFVPHGIEIINVTSYFRAASSWKRLRWAFFSLFSRYYYISGFEPPTYALERWDELLERGRVSAFYASNAHGGFPLTEKTTIEVPSYGTALGYVGLGVDRRYEDAPEEAIRKGDFFTLVRAAGEPERFEFAEDPGELRVLLESRVAGARIDLKRNGRVVASSGTGSLRHPASDPGVYRVEVHLEDHPLLPADVPWILSNPIHAGFEPVPTAPAGLDCESVDEVPAGELRVERDDESTASIDLLDSGSLRLSYHLSRSTPERVDRWVALALRKGLDLSPYRGIYLEASSPEPMRYWVEVRAGDDGHYGSVKVLPNGGPVAVPWNRFYPTLGEERSLPLSKIDAVFVTVNTANSRTGFSAELTLAKLGFCR
jgi:hypothetical protein